ncbi:MAG: hypothetical protein ABI810_21160 [Sphingomonas bacterium]
MAENNDRITITGADPRPAPIEAIETGNATPTALTPFEKLSAPKQESLAEMLDRLFGEPGQAQAAPPQQSPPTSTTITAEPDIYRAIHPDGGLVTMRLLSRMQTDLAVLTQDKRPATYEEVDEAYGHALRAIGLAGSSAVSVAAPGGNASGTTSEDESAAIPDDSATDGASGAGDAEGREAGVTPIEQAAAANGIQQQPAPALDSQVNRPPAPAVPVEAPEPRTQNSDGDAIRPPAAAQGIAPVTAAAGSSPVPTSAPAGAGTTAAVAATPPQFVPQKTRRVGGEWVIAARIGKGDIGRLSKRDIVATPEIRAAATAAIGMVRVLENHPEIMAFGYRMPDGTIQVRLATGKGGSDTFKGHPSGPGTCIFGIHGHPAGSDIDGLVDRVSSNNGYGDTEALRLGIPMATVYEGKIGWHEMVQGQLTFTVPANAVSDEQRSSLEYNLGVSQRNFMAPKIKKKKVKTP